MPRGFDRTTAGPHTIYYRTIDEPQRVLKFEDTSYELSTTFILLILLLCKYGHTYSKSMDQLGKVVNPARGQRVREK